MAAQHKRRGATAKRQRQAGALGRLQKRREALERMKVSLYSAERFESLGYGNELRHINQEIELLQRQGVGR